MLLNHHSIHKKIWGVEEWIVNNDLYCGKKLIFPNDREVRSTTLHYHRIKHETMLCLVGGFHIDYGETGDLFAEIYTGQSIVIPPRLPHRIVAVDAGPCLLIEFSTHHEDSDSFRIGPRRQDPMFANERITAGTAPGGRANTHGRRCEGDFLSCTTASGCGLPGCPANRGFR